MGNKQTCYKRIPTAADIEDYTTTINFAKYVYQAEIITRVRYNTHVVDNTTELQTKDDIAGAYSWVY